MGTHDSATDLVDPTLLRATNRVGTSLRGKWRLDALLGIGGMAAVYAGTHRNGSRGAIKVLHPELSIDSHIRSRFLKEGYAANKVDHPGVVRVLDDDVAEDGSMFLVMELLDGESLEQRRQRMGGRLEADEVLAAADQLLDVLVAAHEKGVIHRDIKPDNVFLTRDGVIKVLDFGIARMREMSTGSQATRAGSLMGTPAFMAPEHARGLWDEVDGRSDLWSVGATMFELLTGQLVHGGRTTNEQLLSAMTNAAPAISAVTPELHADVAVVIDQALAYSKADRYPDARAMQEAVRAAYHALHDTPITSRPRMVVPESVPDRTMPSADVAGIIAAAATTGGAVSAGRTGVPLQPRSSVMSPVLIGVGGALVLGGIIIAMVLALRSHPATTPAAASVEAAASTSPASRPAPPTASSAPTIDVVPAASAAEPEKPKPTVAKPAMAAPTTTARPEPKTATAKPTAPAPKPPAHPTGLVTDQHW